jgi:hypothetical protein
LSFSLKGGFKDFFYLAITFNPFTGVKLQFGFSYQFVVLVSADDGSQAVPEKFISSLIDVISDISVIIVIIVIIVNSVINVINVISVICVHCFY